MSNQPTEVENIYICKKGSTPEEVFKNICCARYTLPDGISYEVQDLVAGMLQKVRQSVNTFPVGPITASIPRSLKTVPPSIEYYLTHSSNPPWLSTHSRRTTSIQTFQRTKALNLRPMAYAVFYPYSDTRPSYPKTPSVSNHRLLASNSSRSSAHRSMTSRISTMTYPKSTWFKTLGERCRLL